MADWNPYESDTEYSENDYDFNEGFPTPEEPAFPDKYSDPVGESTAAETSEIKFHQFNKLPCELRIMIWREAMIAETPQRLVHLQLDDTEPIIIPSKRLISPILLVSHESRHEAQKFYDMRMPIYQHIVTPLPMDQRQYRYWYSGSDKTKEEIRTSSTGKKIGTLYLSTEFDIFVRGLPNAAFIGRMFNASVPCVNTHRHYRDEMVLWDYLDSRVQFQYRVASFAVPEIGSMAQIRRLATVVTVDEYYEDEILGVFNEETGNGFNLWRSICYPNVRDRYMIFTVECNRVVRRLLHSPQEIWDAHDVRRWDLVTIDAPTIGSDLQGELVKKKVFSGSHRRSDGLNDKDESTGYGSEDELLLGSRYLRLSHQRGRSTEGASNRVLE